MFTKRTDLAIEAHELWQESAGKTTRLAGVKATEKKIQGYPVTQVDILDREGEAALGKPAGSYRTLDLTAFWQRGDGFFDRAVRAVGQQVKELTPDSGPVLVVGLGNRAMTPDAVGPLAADSILITRHLIDAMPQHFSGFRPVAALRPGVLGTTGVESAEAVRGLVDRLHPSVVIAVDALASATPLAVADKTSLSLLDMFLGLHGGMMGCREWIRLAKERGIGSWITSALESNVGLNAIAHFCAEEFGPRVAMPQGLGTGMLYTDNVEMPLRIIGDKLWFLKNS